MNTNALCAIRLYKTACFVFCIYQAFLMVGQYIENKDAAGVRYKTYQDFQSGPEQYPTFSFCLLAPLGTHLLQIIKDREFYDELYHHPECQRPNTTHLWCEIQLYQKMLLGMVDITHNISIKNFDSLTIDVVSNITKWKLSKGISENSQIILESLVRIKQPENMLYVSYQDSYRICVTRKNESKLGIDHLFDAFTIPLEFLGTPDLSLEIYVHQFGGLISQLARGHTLKITPKMTARIIEESNSGKEMNSSVSISNEIRFKAIEILHKRKNADTPCNENNHDNDYAYKEAIIGTVGCIPSFWKSLVAKNMNKMSPCTKTTEFQKIANLLPSVGNNKNIKNGTKLYTQPCYDMAVSVTTTSRHEHTIFDEVEPHLSCVFYFEADRFKEIVNHQAFTLGDLWSQIGGFVGIFLGYSCLQVNTIFLYDYEIAILKKISRAYRFIKRHFLSLDSRSFNCIYKFYEEKDDAKQGSWS